MSFLELAQRHRLKAIRQAKGFVPRLLGLSVIQSSGMGLLIPNCQAVHSHWPARPFELVFLDAQYRTLSQVRARPHQSYRHRDASHVLEFYAESVPAASPSDLALNPAVGPAVGPALDPPVGPVTPSDDRGSAPPWGLGLVEGLVSIPLLLVLGLSLIQLIALAQVRLAMNQAVEQAARFAAVRSGTSAAVDQGLARGLRPVLISDRVRPEESGFASVYVSSLSEYAQQRALGRIDWSRVSPNEASFQDWANPSTGLIEPVKTLGSDQPLQPRSGSSGQISAYPVGRVSGQTHADAASLKLRLRYAAPLSVPLAGPLMAKALQVYFGCPRSTGAGQERLAALNLAVGQKLVLPTTEDALFRCRHLEGLDPSGRYRPALLLVSVGIAQMHTPIAP